MEHRSLTPELEERLKACATAEEARALLTAAGVELTDEQLEELSGGYTYLRGLAMREYHQRQGH